MKQNIQNLVGAVMYEIVTTANMAVILKYDNGDFMITVIDQEDGGFVQGVLPLDSQVMGDEDAPKIIADHLLRTMKNIKEDGDGEFSSSEES